MPRKTVAIRGLDTELYTEVFSMAKKDGKNVADVVNNALEQYLNNDDPEAATKISWTQWNIDLQAFADQGVNLPFVNSITLGLSSVTGDPGMMYFDDIRLYPPAP